MNASTRPRFAVMGAGSVGCFFGGMLARAGFPVTLIGRQSHVDAVKCDGLWLDAKAFSEHIPMQASTDASGVAGAKVILFCVKSADSAEAARQMAPHLESDVVILCLQNGAENPEIVRSVLPHRVIPAVVYVATEMAGPGHVKHHGRGELVIGDAPESQDIAAWFAESGVPVEVSVNVMGPLWGKLIINCAYNAISAISQEPYGKMVEVDGVPELMRTVVAECLAVASKEGISVPGDMYETVRTLASTMATQFSSTAQDLARGKPTEIDYLNGYVCRLGHKHHIPTPANQALLTMVKLLSSKSHLQR
ncbi:MAG: 2-dehydropantoate 2-reductase [Oxalobacteraceae bacterium]|nr:2-dehydropantoate 2-reductase [Oxalobacteraceae bacterium]